MFLFLIFILFSGNLYAERIEEVDVFISADDFKSDHFGQIASNYALNDALTSIRYWEIVKEPRYSGYERWYGYIDLGNMYNKRHYFALDLQQDNTFLLYFDVNKNGDLSDDGTPLKNQGSGSGEPGSFACLVKIPWKTLINDSPFNGNFEIWFYVNEYGWQDERTPTACLLGNLEAQQGPHYTKEELLNGRRAEHYSKTQLKGKVNLDGKTYTAYIIDTGYNDADLTNDGIAIDIDGNGRIDAKKTAAQGGFSSNSNDERPKTIHNINGKKYEFNIFWAQ